MDDSGRVLDLCEIGDDSYGYAYLSTLLAERATGPYSVAIATDGDQRLVTKLLITAGWAVSVVDPESTDDYTERFAEPLTDTTDSAPTQRRALGLARALQGGVIAATLLPAAPEFNELRPVLAAHHALANGRQSAAVALREVLRELYPAALRAYPDPADPVALAVVEALPEPGALSSGRGRDVLDSVTRQLTDAGVGDHAAVTEAITALRVAVAETPRRGGLSRSLTPTIAETVRHAVAAVRSCDAASSALVATLAEQAGSPSATAPAPVPTAAAAPAPLPTRVPNQRPPATPEPALERTGAVSAGALATRSRRAAPDDQSGRSPGSVAAPASVPQPRPEPEPVAPLTPVAAASPASHSRTTEAAGAGSGERRQRDPGHRLHNRPVSPPPPPPPGITPIQESTRSATRRRTRSADEPATRQPAADSTSHSSYLPPGTRSSWPTDPADSWTSQQADSWTEPPADSWAGQSAGDRGSPVGERRPDQSVGERGSPLTRDWSATPAGDWGGLSRPTEPAEPSSGSAAPPRKGSPSGDGWPARPSGVTPPWRDNDLRLPEPPALRVVEPDPADPLGSGYGHGAARPEPPPLRLVAPNGGPGGAAPVGTPRSAPPVSADDDDSLLIFAQTRSAWFDNEHDSHWSSAMDLGWQAAEQAAAQPVVGDHTGAGLPRRVPHANLVPGAPPQQEQRPLRVVRDPAAIAAHTSGYFSGWRRGQEVGGYPLGTRHNRRAAGAWEFHRDEDRLSG